MHMLASLTIFKQKNDAKFLLFFLILFVVKQSIELTLLSYYFYFDSITKLKKDVIKKDILG